MRKNKLGQMLEPIKSQRGMALISVYIASIFISTIALSAYTKAFYETRQIEREIARQRSYAAAEGGLQNAMAQMGANAFTGFINDTNIPTSNFQDVYGNTLGTYSVVITYPNEADWVIAESTATVEGETRTMEGRIFLNSNLSKYLFYTDYSSVGLGTNLVFGANNGVDPEGVPANEDDRAATYHTGKLVFSGSNVQIYGDVHAKDQIDGNSTSTIHGDAYVGDYVENGDGSVQNDGISGDLTVTDGFSDDSDRDGDLDVDSDDYPDRHDLTSTGAEDAHAEETLTEINHTFYSTYTDTPSFVGGTDQARYLEVEPNPLDDSKTLVTEYSEGFGEVVGSQVLPQSAIVYVKGDIHIKGQVAGRVSFVSSDDIFIDGYVQYKGGSSYSSVENSTAFLAKDKLFVRPEDLEVSGILYAETASGTSLAIDSNYNVNGDYAPGDKYDGHFRHYGNLVLEGTGNTSNYYNDRAFVYDPNLKYFRPPGIPVVPELRIVREE